MRLASGLLRRAEGAWRDGVAWSGLPLDALAFVLSHVVGERPTLVVVDEQDRATRLHRAIRFFHAKPQRVELFLADDVRPYDGFSPSPRMPGQRARVLHRLDEGTPLMVVVAAEALAKRIPDTATRKAATWTLRPEQQLDRDELVRHLTEVGYLAAGRVDRPGFFAVRGDVVDVWSTRMPRPHRIDFFDDEIEDVRRLDPSTQRTVKRVSSALILPAREEWLSGDALRRCQMWLGKAVASGDVDPRARRRVLEELRAGIRFSGIEDYLPALVPTTSPLEALASLQRVVVHPDSVAATLREAESSRLRRWADLDREERPLVRPEQRYVSAADVLASLEGAHEVFETAGQSGSVSLGASPIDGLAVRGADLGPVASRLRSLLSSDVRLALVARDARRADAVEQLLEPHGVKLVGRASPYDARPGEASLLIGDISSGFIAKQAGWAIVPASALFGGARRTEAARRAHAFFDVSVTAVSDLKEGNLVVHRLHGIGRFLGLSRLSLKGGLEQDFVQLEYLGGDRMYLPATSLGELSKYTPSKVDMEVRLDRLGGQTWASRKRKVRDALLERAKELLDLHAQRELATRPPVEASGEMYRAFEAKFPYQETPDQASAILDVEADLEADVPMDRLICGDVGFGKTEVAMRAAMRVVDSGRQVAVLCPTTVLAFQHFQSFQKRFEGFPVRIGMLSRFSSAAEAKRVQKALRGGELDIVVGTHKLLGRSVKFQNLGLVVVDEEHRFGVSQKNRLRKMRTEVDLLAMSATPIPRTLQMALSGVRQMSIMATPPTDRLAVRTMTARLTRTRVRDAIRLELARGGQVYFVHNRVESIEAMRKRLEGWVPEARFRSAHGKMSGEALETLLMSFVKREFDVLVSTAIVESGVDLPNVNTMIIDRADRFGLSQLYQLRGRVGRGAARGNCLLLTPENTTKEARRRLQVLVENTRLGSGFAIAAADLEQRGGGNLLGMSQSGHIDAVGYDVWVKLLEEAVHAASGLADAERIEPEVELPVAAFIHESLLPDVQQRLGWYRRFSEATTERQVEGLLDTFRLEVGEAPPEVEHLAGLVTTKLLCRELGIVRCDWHRVRLSMELHPSSPLTDEVLRAVAGAHPKRFEVRQASGALRFQARFTPAEAERPLRYVRWVLARLQQAWRGA